MKAKLKLKNQNQLLAALGFVVLGFVVGLAGLFLAVLPQRSHTASLDQQIADAQRQFASLHAVSGRGPSLHAAQLFQLSRAMPDSVDMPGIVDDLSRAAASSSVSILQFSPQEAVVQTDGANAIPLRLTVTGSWHGISQFLRTLRTDVRVGKNSLKVAGRVFVVDTVTLSASGGGATGPSATGPKGELSASLLVDAFTYGLPAPPVSTDTTSTSTTTTSSPPGSAVAAGATGSTG